MKTQLCIIVLVSLFWNIGLCQIQWEQTNPIKGLAFEEIDFLSSTHYVIGVPYQGVYYTEDSGKSWTKINKGLGSQTIESITSIAVSKDSNVFVFIDENLYKWHWGTDKWENLSFTKKLELPVVKVTSSNIIYAMDVFGQIIYISTDGGHDFKFMTKVGAFIKPGDFYFYDKTNNFYINRDINTNESTIYQFQDDGQFLQALYNTTESIGKLQYQAPDKLFMSIGHSVVYELSLTTRKLTKLNFNFDNNVIVSMTNSAKGELVVWTQNGDYIYSNNINWEKLKTNYGSIQLTSSNKYYYNGDEAVLLPQDCSVPAFMRTEDGGKAWKVLDNNWNNVMINNISHTYTGDLIVSSCGAYQNNISVDKGINWRLIKQNIAGPILSQYYIDQQDKWYSFKKDSLYTSNDKGITWSFIWKYNGFLQDGFVANNANLVIIRDFNFGYYSKDQGKTFQISDLLSFTATQLILLNDLSYAIIDVFGLVTYADKNFVKMGTQNIPSSYKSLFYANNGTIYFIDDGTGNLLPGTYMSNDGLKTIQFICNEKIEVLTQSQNGVVIGLDESNKIIALNEQGNLYEISRLGFPAAYKINDLSIDKDGFLFVNVGKNYLYKSENVIDIALNNSEVKELPTSCLLSTIVADQLLIQNQVPANTTIRLINLGGQQIMESKLDEDKSVDVSQLNEGIYFIHFVLPDGYKKNEKFIKQNNLK